MFLGHSNFSSWVNAKLLAIYGRKRFNIHTPLARQAYIAAHENPQNSAKPENHQWSLPVDLQRVCFTNLSLYNTEYSVFKYLLETELDVLQKPPYNQVTIYAEIIKNHTAITWTRVISSDHFLVGINTGLIEQISDQFLKTDVIDKVLANLTGLSKINATFLKSFAMELAVKASIYNEFAQIFSQNASSQQPRPSNTPLQSNLLAGEFLLTEIQNRTRALLESDFFDDTQNIREEMFAFCTATLYLFYAQQTAQTNCPLSADEAVFCTFYSLTENATENTQIMLDSLQKAQQINQPESLEINTQQLFEQYQAFCNKINNTE